MICSLVVASRRVLCHEDGYSWFLWNGNDHLWDYKV